MNYLDSLKMVGMREMAEHVIDVITNEYRFGFMGFLRIGGDFEICGWKKALARSIPLNLNG